MLKKVLITLFAVMALSSLGSVFLAGLSIYIRATDPLPIEEKKVASVSVVTEIGSTHLSHHS